MFLKNFSKIKFNLLKKTKQAFTQLQVFIVMAVIFLLAFVYLLPTLINREGKITKSVDQNYEYEYVGKKEEIQNILFTDKVTNLPMVEIKESDSSISFKYIPKSKSNNVGNNQSQLKSNEYKTKVETNKLTYFDIEKGTNLIYTITDGKTVKEDIELTKRPDETNQDLTYEFELSIKNLTYTINEEGFVNPVFTDKDGVEYTIPTLIMNDSNNAESTDIQMLITQKDPSNEDLLSVLLIPNKEWILSDDRQYPILIDPTLVRGNAPVYHWKLDEGYGGTTQDFSSSNADGTLGASTAAPTWQNEDMCISGKCLYFDGSNDYVDLGNIDAPIEGAGDFSFSFWMNPNNAVAGVYQTIIGTNDPTGYNIGWSIGMNYPSNGSICFAGDNSAGAPWGYSDCRDIGVASNQWIFLTFTRTGTNVDWYVNGSKYGSTGVMGYSFANGAYNLTLGATASKRYFKGKIDDLRIYNYVRSAVQIKSDYINRGGVYGVSTQFGKSNTTSGSNLSHGLVGYWKLDESSGGATDSSGNAYTLTDASSTTYGAGKFGNGADLESGSTDYQYIADNSALSITGSTTVSAWIKPESVTAATLFDIAGKWDGANESYLLSQYGDEIRFYVNAAANYATTNTTNLSAGTWYHVTATYNAQTAIVTIMVNGVIQESTISGTIPSSIGDDAGRFHIGAEDSTGGANSYYDGVVDDVHLYNRVLTESEVRALYSYAPGPTGYWKFDENTGASANDSSGNANTGTITTANYDFGKLGSSLNFDSTDRVSVAGATSINIARMVTVEAWVKPNVAIDTMSSSYPVILMKRPYNTAGYGLWVNNAGDNTVNFQWCWSGGCATVASTTILQPNTWYHVAATLDTASAKIYINGIQENTATVTTPMASSTDTLTIGNESPWSGTFEGKIDDVKIYNYARNAGQVVSDMNGGHPAPGSPVGSAVGYWKFDEGRDDSCSGGANDVCNYGNGGAALDGAQSNMAVPATSSSGWTNSGKFGKAMNFDGSNDFVTVTDSVAINFVSQPFTISTWIHKNASFGDFPNFKRVIDKIEVGVDNGYGLDIHDSQIRLLGSTSAFFSFNSASSTWYHVVVSTDGVTTASLYVDGVFRGSAAYAAANAYTQPLFFGKDHASGSYFNGMIDETRIYNFALTSDQVKVEYNQGKAQVIGSLSTASDGKTADNSSTRSYCVPGDTSSCSAPILDWQFNEKTGTTTYDSAGGYSGTLGTGNTWVTGKYGAGVHGATGTADYIDAGAITPVRFTNSSTFTYSAWVKASALSPSGYYSMVFKQDGSSGTFVYSIQAFGDNSPKICALVGKSFSVDYAACSSADLTIGRWYHVTGVYSSSVISLYLDGKYISSDTYVTSAATAPSGDFAIGGDPSTGNRYFDGAIDNLRVYDYARTPAQIAWDYNRGAPVAWYKFDECTSTTINNWGPNANGGFNGNNGTLTIGGSGSNTSAGTCTTSGAWYDGSNGQIGSGMDFDGTDDYVSVGDVSSLSFERDMPFSVSAWVKPNITKSGPEKGYAIVSKREASVPLRGWVLYLDYNSFSGSQTWTYFTLSNTWGSNWLAVGVTTFDVPNSNWIHITATYDGSSSDSGVKLYLNGIPYNTYTVANALSSTILNSSPVSIGACNDGSGSYPDHFNGLIDDVRVYNYVLTAAQVRDVYNNGAVTFK